jgi:outer membrane protein
MHFNVRFLIRLPFAVWALSLLLVGASARADDDDAKAAPESSHWGLGLALGTERSLYKGISSKSLGIPLISYENSAIRVFGNTLDVKLPPVGPVRWAFRTKVALGEGYKASDSSFLTGMDTRKGSLDIGLAAMVPTPYAKLTMEWLGDASGHSKGQQLKFGVERPFMWNGRFELTPSVGVTWLDKKYVDYYYGVKPTEATTARPEYLGKATTNVEAALRMGYLIDTHQRVFFEVSETHWGSGITKSPIVDKTTTPGLRFGYLYRF